MVNGTTSSDLPNAVAVKLGHERGCTLTRVFSTGGIAMVETIGEAASELWALGPYEVSLSNVPKLSQWDQGPYLLAAYNGRLPQGRDGQWEARKLLERDHRLLIAPEDCATLESWRCKVCRRDSREPWHDTHCFQFSTKAWREARR